MLRMRGSTPITSENPISGGNNSSSTKPMKGCFLRSSFAAMGAASFRYAREASVRRLDTTRICSGLEWAMAISTSHFNRLNGLVVVKISISSLGCRSMSARTRGARKTLQTHRVRQREPSR